MTKWAETPTWLILLYERLNKHKSFFVVAFFILSTLMILCRAAFYSNYDLYRNIQKVPTSLVEKFQADAALVGKDKASVKQLHHYIKGYGDELKELATGLVNPSEDYLLTHEFNRNRFLWFKAFLILDFGFLVLFFSMLYFVVSQCFIDKNFYLGKKYSPGKLYFLICSLAILLDLIENTLLLTGMGTLALSNGIYLAKMIAIVLALLYWFKFFHEKYFKKLTIHVLRALAACSISLLVIIFVLVLLTQMAQGITLVIDLYTDPLNSILFLLFALFTSLLLSHFPIYLFIRFFDNERYQWIWSRRFWLPVIYYNEIKNPIQSTVDRSVSEEGTYIFKFIRHYLGTFFLLMMLYAFVFSWNKTSYRIPAQFLNEIFILAGLFLALLQRNLLQLRTAIKHNIFSKLISKRFLRSLRTYEILLIASIAFLIVRIFITDWNLFNKIFTVLQISVLILAYILFRENRSLLKYKYGLSKRFSQTDPHYNFLENAGEEKIVDHYPLIDASKRSKLISKKNISHIPILGNFSNNVYYLFVIAIIGLFVPIGVILISLSPAISLINGANYLLVFLMVFYSLFITVVKVTFYGENKGGRNLYIKKKNRQPPLVIESDNKTKILFFPLRYTGFASVVVLIILFGLYQNGNDLYLLKPIEIEDSEWEVTTVDKGAFLDQFAAASDTTTAFAISAFGGGLKANYNTMKTIHEIEKAMDGKFIENTISMSGVSGGGLGLANYYLMNNFMEQESNEIASHIEEIGDLDIVSIDIPYFLMIDLVRTFIPNWKWIWNYMEKKNWDRDRSQIAMKKYKDIIAPEENLEEAPFQKIHKSIHDRGKHAPALIMNTTSTRLEYGVASSVQVDQFPGAINILEAANGKSKSGYTLNFYDAVSTINRFPLLSPAAKIKNTGHFVDGGYFENSGILTTISFLNLLSDHEWSPNRKLQVGHTNKKVVIVNLLNSKVHWINHLLTDTGLDPNKMRIRESQASEFSSIVGTVTGTEMLPNYFVEALKEKSKTPALDSTFKFVAFYIPYKVYMDDIEQYLSAEPRDVEEMRKILVENNTRIDSILMASDYKFKAWGVVEPALARKLSVPDKKYQDVMIENHPYLRQQIKRLKQ